MSDQSDSDLHTTSRSQADVAAHLVRVLVVDPDPKTRALYREVFDANGWDVVEGADGREALVKALARPPALVVTEIRLPFLDGYALCDILHRDRATKAVPILVVTAEARIAGPDGARRVGANAVLVKPTTPEQVLAETRRLLSDRRDADRSESPPAAPPVESSPLRPRLSKSFARFVTTTPPASPPQLVCPSCDESLTYEQSYVGGVSAKNAEQWDVYVCPRSCGTFQYRHRTRKLGRA
jgi:two-component system, chemotaxis family, chemotaxis protein CheY